MNNSVPGAPPNDPDHPFQGTGGRLLNDTYHHTPLPRGANNLETDTSGWYNAAYTGQGGGIQARTTYQAVPMPIWDVNSQTTAPGSTNITYAPQRTEFDPNNTFQYNSMPGGAPSDIGFQGTGGGDAFRFHMAIGQRANSVQHDLMMGGVPGNVQEVYAGASSRPGNPTGNRDNGAIRGTGNVTGGSIYFLGC